LQNYRRVEGELRGGDKKVRENKLVAQSDIKLNELEIAIKAVDA
jgi:hypothetical protein